ncbi:hypothetical protein [Cellulophaga fucicola]|uniref:hypothetical protein n=1 Tax=Cellulophaga fucicola TaxID=76595 RepID=UPI003EBFF1DE
MQTRYLKIYGFIIAVILTSCGGGGDDSPTEPEIFIPTAVELSLPANDEVCLTGVSVNDSQATVAFSWQAATNVDSYNVEVKNLTSGQVSTFASATEATNITLNKGEPYSWQVISTSSSTTETAESAIWKFYLAGDGVVNYAPFMAEALVPAVGATVTATSSKVTLSWQGADVDNDIKDYEVFFGTATLPTTSLSVTTDTFLEVDVTANTIYYWRVKTTDEEANSSISEIFEFKVN